MPAWNETQASEIIAGTPAARARCCRSCTPCRRRSATCPPTAVPVIAEALNLTRAEVHGVVTLLSRLPRRAGRPARAEALPRRGLPVDGRRGAGRSRCASASASTGASTTPDGARDARAGLLPRPVRLRAVGACSTASRSAGSTTAVDRRHRARGRPMTHAHLRPARCRGPRRRRRRGRGRDRSTRPAPAASTSRSCAPARAACSGWSRWSRSRRRAAASPTGR